MTNEVQVVEQKLPAMTFGPEQVALLKRTVCRGATDDELALFIHVAKRSGLDPFARQVHAVKRYDSASKQEVMSIQTGIDGYRLIAERTGCYSPGREPSFTYDKNGKLVTATAYIKKLVAGEWHEVSATAHFSEYAAHKRDGNLTHMWEGKPHIMLAKCAEALAIRRAFPAELSGLYTHEEMEQALEVKPSAVEPEKIEVQRQQDKPAPDSASKPAERQNQDATGLYVDGVVEEINAKEGTNKKGQPWKRWGVKIGKEFYGTFDRDIGKYLEDAHGYGEKVRVWYTERQDKGRTFRDIVKAEIVQDGGKEHQVEEFEV
jgi:phage recombination protein Bet